MLPERIYVTAHPDGRTGRWTATPTSPMNVVYVREDVSATLVGRAMHAGYELAGRQTEDEDARLA